MKLKLDEKFLPLDYSQSLYLKFHRLRHHNEQSVANYTEQFYKLLSRINLTETDDQLVARYTSGLKLNLQGELMMHPIHSLEEVYQMALKVEEKVKCAPFGKDQQTGLPGFLLVLLSLVQLLGYNGVEGTRDLLEREDHQELEKQLKLTNKPVVKTIKTQYGDIYDCMDFYKQSAFDHLLLKNHSFHFEMKPT
ncbi:hypothetical protein RHGRI_005298 [Rhododendron griersonianum]|uniref:Retrotransposon gag domain-containing protein n=1 Tax=Rhododendron griersonianum TaxID=479676 RepID=A0AAV6LC63_9ERIC|nr:hypothetical protein RHGRI_005298 [Rhododendron griersonianum]